MKRNGFLLIESIIMFIVLITALMTIYVGTSNYIARENQHSFYDDIASIYKGYYIKEALINYTVPNSINNSLLNANNVYGRVIGVSISTIFSNTTNINAFNQISNTLNMHQIYYTNDIENLKTCAKNINFDTKCKNTYLDEGLRAFINTINKGNITDDDILIFEFRNDKEGNTCTSNECYSYYTWVAL